MTKCPNYQETLSCILIINICTLNRYWLSNRIGHCSYASTLNTHSLNHTHPQNTHPQYALPQSHPIFSFNITSLSNIFWYLPFPSNSPPIPLAFHPNSPRIPLPFPSHSPLIHIPFPYYSPPIPLPHSNPPSLQRTLRHPPPIPSFNITNPSNIFRYSPSLSLSSPTTTSLFIPLSLPSPPHPSSHLLI